MMVLGLGGLAAGSLFASDLPIAWAWLGSPAVLAYAAWLARRELRRPWRCLQVPRVPDGRCGEPAGEPEPPLLDGLPLEEVRVRWRGPAGFLHCRGERGRFSAIVLWPDVTSAQGRRELRLALRDRETSPSRASMAP